MSVPEISVTELKQKLDSKQDILIIDVREPSEFEYCNLGGLLIPLGELALRLDEIDKSKQLAVLCRSGKRSHQATLMLNKVGFKANNITGGILAWSKEIDSSISAY